MTVAKKARRNDGQKMNMPTKQTFRAKIPHMKKPTKIKEQKHNNTPKMTTTSKWKKNHGDRANIFQTSSRHGSDII